MNFQTGFSRDAVERAIDQYVLGRNAERNRKIIRDKLIDGLTFEKIAEKYDLSVTQVKRIVYNGDEIFRHIK